MDKNLLNSMVPKTIKTIAKSLALIFFVMLFSNVVKAQSYKNHYIAPAPWVYFSEGNELVLATNSVTPVNVTIKKSDGTTPAITPLNSDPLVIGKPKVYRFVGAVNASGNERHALNTVLNNAGLIVIGDQPITVNLRNVVSDQDLGYGLDDFIKGNSSLFSFGDAAVGTSFRVGYYRDGDIYNSATRPIRPIYSVMAINNGTILKINGTPRTTLNAGQSYLFQDHIGSLVETSGPAVMNTSGAYDAPGGNCFDGTSNPVAPVSSLGTQYIVVRGNGNDISEQTTVVASEDNTVVTVISFTAAGAIHNTRVYTLAAAGDFVTFDNGVAGGTGALNTPEGQIYSATRIQSSKRVAAYSGTADNCEVDIATLVPISDCTGSTKVQAYKFRKYTPADDLPYFAYIVLNDANAKVFITTDNGLTNKDIETLPGVGVRRQLGSTGLFIIDFNNAEIANPSALTLESTSRLTVSMVQQGGGFSMSNFLTPLPEKALVPTFAQGDCASAVLSADPNSRAPFQWYLDGVMIPGATSINYTASVSGVYSVTTALDCGNSAQSLPITVNLCNIDRAVTKIVDNATPVIGSTVNFTITAKNIGPGNAINVVVTDALPTGFTYVSHSSTAGTSYDNATGKWLIGSLAANGLNPVTLVVSAITQSTGSYQNTATISGPQSDVSAGNDVASVTPTVVPTIALSSASGTDAQVVCYSATTPITPIVYTFGGTTTGATANLPAGLTGVYTAATTSPVAPAKYTITGIPAVTVGAQPYKVSTEGGPTLVEITGSLTVNASVTDPVFNAYASNRCQGADVVTYTATANYSSGITYSVSPAAAGTINVNTGQMTWSAAFTGNATITASASGCSGPKATSIVITVSSGGVVTPDYTTVCAVNNIGSLNATGVTGTIIRWEYSTDAGATWISIANTSSNQNYSGLTESVIYRVVSQTPACAEVFSAMATINVSKIAIVAPQTTNICSGNSFLVQPSGVPGGTTYSWSVPTVISGSVAGGASGNNESNITGTLTGNGTVRYTVTPKSGFCEGTAFTVTVNVFTPTTRTISYGGPYCYASGGMVNPTFGGTTTGITSSTFASTIGLSIDVNTGVVNVAASQAGNYTVTNTYSNGSCTSMATAIIVISVSPTTGTIVAPADICENSSATISLSNIPNGNGTSYTVWTAASGGTNLGTVPYTTPNLLANTTYYIQPTNTCGDGVRTPVEIKIKSSTLATPITPGTSTICEGTTLQLANATTGGTWGSSNTSVATINSSGLVTAIAPGTVLISYITSSGCTSETLTINPAPRGINVTATVDCVGQLNHNLQNDISNGIISTFNWTINAPASVIGATAGSGNIINQTLFNTSTTAQIVTYTVTPKSTLAGACDGNPFTVTVTVPVCSTISITKTTNVTAVNTVGSVIPYTITVVNNGNANHTNVVLTDALLGGVIANPVKTGGNADAILEKGETWTYTGNYTVTQTDFNNNGNPANNSGKITNSASIVTDQIPAGQITTKDVTITLVPSISLVKTGALNLDGNTIGYNFIIKNTGNVNISGLTISDSKVATVIVSPTFIAPGATATGTATYTVLTSEQEAGSVSNTATATGNTPTGGTVTDISGTAENNDNPTITPTGVYPLNDVGTINGLVGGTAVANVLVNDKINGNPATLADVTIKQVSTSDPKVTIEPATGKVNVAPNTPAGIYTLVYEIEDKLNPGQKKTATVTITVTAPPLVATDDSGTINGLTGGTAVADVLVNDTYNGNPATLSTVTIKQVSTTDPKVTIDPATGKVNVAPNTPAGNYTLVYEIEDKLNPGQKKTATVTITVTLPTIVANADNGMVNGLTGGTAVTNVLVNDSYNGNPATLNDVIIKQVSTTDPKVTIDPATGIVNVAPNTPAGNYILVYEIEDKLNPGQKKTAIVTVTVTAPAIVATDDSGTINGATGGTAVANVLVNDTYNGNPATLNDVTIKQISTTDPKVTIDPATGKVNVAPNTPAGNYTLVYEIEDKLNPGQKKTATVTVTVTAPAIVANADNGTANGTTGGTAVANVLVNDTYNGNPATLNDVIIKQVSTTDPKVTIDPATGKVNVAPNTPAGNYTLVYEIEDKLNPGQKKTATVTITVTSNPVTANPDTGTILGFFGGTIQMDILANDVYNGNTQATLNDVTITQLSTENTKINIDVATGKIIVQPRTLPGVYVVRYQITDKLDPNNKSITTVIITIPNWITDLTVTKTASKTGVEVGDNITYTIIVKNIGTATVLAGRAIVLNETLPAGLDNVTYTATGGVYSASANTFTTAADIDAGQSVTLLVNGRINVNYAPSTITNTVSVDAAQLAMDPNPNNNTATVTTPILRGKITLVKTGVLSADGNTITYSFLIKNTGNVALNSIVLTDPKIGLNTTIPGTLSVGVSTIYTRVYALSQADKDLGSLTNTATVTSKSPMGNTITDISGTTDANDVPTVVNIPALGKLTLTKVVSSGTIPTTVGGALNYTLIVANSGNVTLRNIVVTDPNATVSGSPITSLSPGNSVAITAVHILTQADIDAGSVTNQASATAKDPKDNTVTRLSDDPSTGAVDDPTITTIGAVSSISLTKTANNTGTKAGDVINYTLMVKNTGNTTLSNIVVTDNGVDAGSILPATVNVLQPGAVAVVVAKYTLKQADINAGSYSNQASVTARDTKNILIVDLLSDDPNTPALDDPTIVLLSPNADLVTIKKLKNAAQVSYIPGDEVVYLIGIKNNGPSAAVNVKVTDIAPLGTTITRWTATSSGVTLPATSGYGNLEQTIALFPVNGETIYEVVVKTSNGDTKSIYAGTPLSNTVTVTSSTPDLSTVGDITVTPAIPAAIQNDLSIVKTSDHLVPTGLDTPYDYTIVVKNNGNFTSNNVVVTDILPASLSYVSHTVTKGTANYTTSSNTLGWTIPTIESGAVVTLNIKVKATKAGIINNTAVVQASEIDPNTANNTSTDLKEIFSLDTKPNVITPNGDGKNDNFVIDGLQLYPENFLTIFNRWGNEVYHSNGGYKNDWGGNGLKEGTYYYLLKVKDTSGNWTITKGYITLLRNN